MIKIIQVLTAIILLTFVTCYIFGPKVATNPMNVSPHIPITAPITPPPPPSEPETTMKTLLDLNYANSSDKEQTLDLYIPAAKKFPTVVFVHGGAWNTGNKEMYEGVGIYLQARGIACAVINYRLSPRVVMPAHIEDTAKAFSYTKDRISSLGGNGKIFLIGHSAGGHLASMIATDNKYLNAVGCSTTDISGVVSISGIYSINLNVNIFGSGPVFRGCNKASLSPINHVKKGMPPFLVMYASKDIPTLSSQAKNFYNAYAKSGNEGTLVLYKGTDHRTIIINTFTPGNSFETEFLTFLNR